MSLVATGKRGRHVNPSASTAIVIAGFFMTYAAFDSGIAPSAERTGGLTVVVAVGSQFQDVDASDVQVDWFVNPVPARSALNPHPRASERLPAVAEHDN